MGNIAILNRTQELLEEVPLGGRVDLLLTQKYGMSFDEFISRRVVREKGYDWDVGSDAMEWETAVSGIKTMRRNIEELLEEGCTDRRESAYFWNRP